MPAENVPFSCEREAYPSYFSPFQNLPASCKRSLKILHGDRDSTNYEKKSSGSNCLFLYVSISGHVRGEQSA